ncbi:MAG TPA: LamG domain-containing protein, partial [Flavobacteriales bacterium]|nr:LamG domain-containing protein [Flavobacteriales bacterium]
MKKLLLLFTLLISINCLGQVPGYVPTDSLVGWWPFNGNANDESVNGNDGTVNGATLTTDRFGNANAAYDFDGVDDYIEIIDDPSIKPLNAISISGWANLSSNETSNFPRFVNKNHNQAQNYGSYQIIGGHYGYDSIGYSAMGTRTTTIYTWTGHGGSSEILDDWFFFVGVYDGTQMRYYINGILVKTKAQTGSLVYNTENLTFAGNYLNGIGTPDFTQCFLDDIGIWNRALSQCEISALYYAQQLNSPSVSF